MLGLLLAEDEPAELDEFDLAGDCADREEEAGFAQIRRRHLLITNLHRPHSRHLIRQLPLRQIARPKQIPLHRQQVLQILRKTNK